jgi:hypothetical protein
MDEGVGRQSRPQYRDCCHRKQAGQDQLGGVVEWRKLSPDAQEGRKTVKWRAREPALKYGSFMTVAINKDGHARIIIMRPETILH